MTEQPSLLSEEDAREYSESMGQIGEGWWRQIAWAFRQRIPEALGMTRREWVTTYHGYVRLALQDRREAVRELTEQGMSTWDIGDVLGVNHDTVAEDRKALVGNPTIGPSAESEPVGNPTPEPESEEPEPAIRIPVVAHNSGDFEWYSPPQWVEAARRVMGGVDLDPASTEVANQVIQAERFYTAEEDGLTRPWAGRVWMNPPYMQPAVDRFCARLAREVAAGSVAEACVLVNNATETAWFQTLVAEAAAICFPRGRTKYWHPDKETAPLQGQAIVYLGTNIPSFRREFLPFGFVVLT